MQPGLRELGEVRGTVLSGVEHHRRAGLVLVLVLVLFRRAGVAVGVEQGRVAGGELVQDGSELGDVGAVAGVGVAGDRDRAVAGHHEREADEAEVVSSLFGVASFGDRGCLVC